MIRLLALGILAAATPARAAPLYTEDAAAVAAFFASSVPLTAAKVAVHDVEGPPELAGSAEHALRAELFRLGVPLVRPEGAADYDLRGKIVAGPRTVWHNYLWRKSDGTLAALYDRTLIVPGAPPPASGRGGGRPWRVLLGANVRDSGLSWLAGALWACPTGRWEAGLDVGNFAEDRQTQTNRARPLGVPAIETINAKHSYSVWHFRLKADGLMPVSARSFLTGWLPRKGTLRAGAGMALVQVTDRLTVDGNTFLTGAVYPTTLTSYLRPLIEAGFRLPVSARLGFDLGMEWMPAIRGADNADFGGFSSSVRAVF